MDLRQRLELPFADALENPAVITGLTYHERRERFGKKGQKLKKDAIVYKFPNQNLDTSDGWNKGDSVHFVTLDNEIKPIGVADLDLQNPQSLSSRTMHCLTPTQMLLPPESTLVQVPRSNAYLN